MSPELPMTEGGLLMSFNGMLAVRVLSRREGRKGDDDQSERGGQK